MSQLIFHTEKRFKNNYSLVLFAAVNLVINRLSYFEYYSKILRNYLLFQKVYYEYKHYD